MSLVRETAETASAAYAGSVEAARAARQNTYTSVVNAMGIDRDQTLETDDPDTAFIHFLGNEAFQIRPHRAFSGYVRRVQRELEGDEERTGILFQGVRRHRDRLPIEPEYARPTHTSLAIVEGASLMLQSSVELRPNVDVGWGRPTTIAVRRLGIVANTATLLVDLEDEKQVKQSSDQEIITTGDVLPLLLAVQAEERDEKFSTIFTAFDEHRIDLIEEPRRSQIGWDHIPSALRNAMDFDSHLHYRDLPMEVTEADVRRFQLIDALAEALDITPEEQRYIDFLHNLPKGTAEFPKEASQR